MKSILVFAALAATFAAAPAFAQSADPLPSISVRHADLDLTRAHDLRRLDHRIAHAVRDVCGEASSADPRGQVNVVQCRTETYAVATAQRAAFLAARQQVAPVSVAAR